MDKTLAPLAEHKFFDDLKALTFKRIHFSKGCEQ
jgi:hypothetical protein